jgi:hypothetical protein
MRRARLIATLLLAAGCLGPRPDPSSFFLLSPVVAPVQTPDVAAVTVGLGPVTLPGYLDRPQIVERVSDNEIVLSETERWAEPLRDNVARTLRENLSRHLPASSWIEYPWYASEAPAYAIAVDVRRFEADVSGSVVLDASWRIAADGEDVDRGRTEVVEPAGSVGQAARVAAQSRALGALSAQVAAAVRQVAGRR